MKDIRVNEKLLPWIEKLENINISFPVYLLTFFCIVFVRNFLETFCDADNFLTAVSAIAFFIHYPLFYLCALLGLAFIFHWLLRQNIISILKIVLFFLPIIWLGPLLDLIISKGQGYNISYLFGDWKTILYKFVTFAGDPKNAGATPGIRIELSIVFILIAAFIYLKKKTLIDVILGLILSYIFFFSLGATPSIITNLFAQGEGKTTVMSGEVILYHFYTFNHKISMVLIIILVIELILFYYIYDRLKFRAIIGNLRGLRTLHYLAMLGFGFLIGSANIPHFELNYSFYSMLIHLLGAMAVCFAWWVAIGVNDQYDLETDHLSNPNRPLVSGNVNHRELIIINFCLLLLSLSCAWLVRYQFLIPVLTALSLSYLYSAAPFRFKGVPMLATFLIALSSLLIVLSGYVIYSANYSFYGFPLKLIPLIVLSFTLGFTVKDIKDFEGDQKAVIKTIPVIFGVRRGKKIVAFAVFTAYFIAPVFYFSFLFMIISGLLGAISLILVSRSDYKELPVFLLYLLYLVITGYFIYPDL